MMRHLGPAGFWRRAAALAVDAMWLFTLAGTLSIVTVGVAWPGPAGIDSQRLVALLLYVAMPGVLLVACWRLLGASPGKLLLDLRIIDADSGAQPATPRLLLRYAGYFLSLLPFGLGFAAAAFDRERRALHDRIARTRVVRVAETDLDLARPLIR